jgi:enamine deaminase RidA (YjgF/YER057c/UK114 family)
VKDIDTQYAGMAAARRAFFEQEGLTSETHYIASTGIEGQHIQPEALVFMDAYAVQGLQPAQMRYLHAPQYLNPTHEYGVTFERGTVIDYGDRRQVYISGTASINNRGEVVHPGDLPGQMERTLLNIQALLAEGETDMNDVAYLIVYLRNGSDFETVNTCLQKVCPRIPRVIVRAPVCRPDWLVEIECMAIKPLSNCLYDPF